ncbi:MAG: hypothetical protein WAU01_13565 [Saprospiraceae bacterium]
MKNFFKLTMLCFITLVGQMSMTGQSKSGAQPKGTEIDGLASTDETYIVALNKEKLGIIKKSTGQMQYTFATFRDAVSVNFQQDGNLVVKNSFGDALWSSQTHNKQVKDIILQPDGQLVIRGGVSGSDIIWSSRPPVDSPVIDP